jgi:hypothetical protein
MPSSKANADSGLASVALISTSDKLPEANPTSEINFERQPSQAFTISGKSGVRLGAIHKLARMCLKISLAPVCTLCSPLYLPGCRHGRRPSGTHKTPAVFTTLVKHTLGANLANELARMAFGLGNHNYTLRKAAEA